MNKKRLIACLLSVCLVFSVMFTGVTAFADTSETDVVEVGEAFWFMNALGIITDTEENSGSKVTRSMFAGYLANMLGITDVNSSDVNRYFKDVPLSDRSAAAIAGLYERGIIKGTGDLLFLPDELIGTKDAAVMLVRSLYNEEFIATVGNIDNIIVSNKLISGMDMTSITVNDAAEMIMNALEMNTLYYNSKGYYFNENETFLQDLYDVYKIRGVLNGAEGISLSNRHSIEDDQVIIDNKIYDTKVSGLYSLLGCGVVTYVQEEKNADRGRVIYCIQDNTTKIVEFNFKDFIGIDSQYNITYYNNRTGREYEAKLSANATVIKNGTVVTKNIRSAFDEQQGVVKLIATDGQNYNMAVISAYDSGIVTGVNSSGPVVYVDGITPIKDFDNYDRVRVYDVDGKIINPSTLQAGVILTVYRSNNCLEIYVEANSIKGKLEAKKDEKVIIDGVEYDILPKYKTKLLADMNIGTTGVFFLNRFNEIVYAEGSEKTDIGLLVAVGESENFDSFFRVKMYTSSGEMKIFKTSGKLKIDDGKYSAAEAKVKLASTGPGNGVVSQVVAYRSNGEIIKSVDTAADGKGNDFHKVGEKIDRGYAKGINMLLPDVVLANNTVVFKSPQLADVQGADDKDFMVGTSVFVSDELYPTTIYSFDDGFFADCILLELDTLNYEVTWGADPYIVNDVRTVIGEDGEVKKELSVAGYPNTMMTFVVSEQLETPALNKRGSTYINFVQSAVNEHRKFVTPDDISAGDIVFLVKDHRSEVVRIFLYHDYDNPTFNITDVRRGSVDNQRRLTSGYILKKEENAFGFSFTSPNATIVDEVTVYTSASASSIIFDKDSRGEKVYIGTIGEIVTAESSPEDASYIVTMRDHGSPRMTIIYK